MPPKSSKPTFRTTIPFTETHWPVISPTVRDNILHLLCHLLQPLGDHRKTHIHPSKGKSRKRKRKQQDDDAGTMDSTNPPPPPPEIKNHILIGLNSITRHLEALVAQNTLNSHVHSSNDEPHNDTKEQDPAPPPNLRRISIILLPHPNPSHSLAHAHIPPLVQLSTSPFPRETPSSPSASANPPPNPSPTPKTYLIPLPTTAEADLASALHIPRVGALAILDSAPGAESLVDYVRENVGDGGEVECKWVTEAMDAAWKGVKIVS